MRRMVKWAALAVGLAVVAGAFVRPENEDLSLYPVDHPFCQL